MPTTFLRRVSPLACGIALGLLGCRGPGSAVPVHEEPRHRPVLETDAVRILDLRLPPGDTSEWHRHANDIFYAVVDGSNIWAEPRDGTPTHVRWNRGHLSDNTTQSRSPVVHRVGNDGPGPFRLIAVEHLGPATPEAAPSTPLPLGAPVVHDERFVAYVVTVAPGDSIAAHVHPVPAVVVQFTAGTVEHRGHRESHGEGPGAWHWFEVGAFHAYRNAGRDTVRLTEIEVR